MMYDLQMLEAIAPKQSEEELKKREDALLSGIMDFGDAHQSQNNQNVNVESPPRNEQPDLGKSTPGGFIDLDDLLGNLVENKTFFEE